MIIHRVFVLLKYDSLKGKKKRAEKRCRSFQTPSIITPLKKILREHTNSLTTEKIVLQLPIAFMLNPNSLYVTELSYVGGFNVYCSCFLFGEKRKLSPAM